MLVEIEFGGQSPRRQSPIGQYHFLPLDIEVDNLYAVHKCVEAI